MSEKPVLWLGSALMDLRSFPQSARKRAGYALDRVQRGLDPPDWKPMRAIGPGVRELRIQVSRQFRVLYVANLRDAIYVLHAFEKKARKTSMADLAIARRRLSLVRRDS